MRRNVGKKEERSSLASLDHTAFETIDAPRNDKWYRNMMSAVAESSTHYSDSTTWLDHLSWNLEDKEEGVWILQVLGTAV
jgi:hypothetical protein